MGKGFILSASAYWYFLAISFWDRLTLFLVHLDCNYLYMRMHSRFQKRY